MGKNNRKNRKLREQQAFLELAAARDGETLPKRKPATNVEADTQQDPDAYENGALIVAVDEDLDVPDIPTTDLPPPTGNRTKSTPGESMLGSKHSLGPIWESPCAQLGRMKQIRGNRNPTM